MRRSTTQGHKGARFFALLLGLVLAVAGITMLWGCTASGGSGGSGTNGGGDTPAVIDNGGSNGGSNNGGSNSSNNGSSSGSSNGSKGNTGNGGSKGTFDNGGTSGLNGNSGGKSGSNGTNANNGSNTNGGNGSHGGFSNGTPDSRITVTEDGHYTSKDEVALYIHTFGHLPSNYINKTNARNAGWDSSEGNLAEVCPGMSIGGSQYYDEEKQLPEKKGRTWTECDINYVSGYRGAERIVFSNDGLIFYTRDHYKTFERLY